ncbi:O-antigen ligase family protein [Geminicoccus harenae]|uniref:O-antigen ligase family protein n=1 Tax=Geminicoccus harenae TaxID=2498453 RepID=UPI001C972300|nr:O-antigen ligase family protein [Geminicoccus harenae]
MPSVIPALPRRLALTLLVLLAALAMLSADQAERLALGGLRMPVFLLVCLVLAALCLMLRPRLDPDEATAPALLLLLAAVMAVLDLQGQVDPLDYKLLLPVLALLIAGPLAAMLGPLDLPGLLWRLLALYVLAASLSVLVHGTEALARGADGVVRIDASGSLVTHGSMCVLALGLSAMTWSRAGVIGRLLRLLVLGAGGLLLLAAATRTPFLVLAIAALLVLVTSRRRGRWLSACLLLAAVGALVLLLHTLLIDASLWRRLTADGQAEWSTGRAVAIAGWLERAADHPLGMGLGTVRATLADGKPSLDGDAIFDWPHNEAVRLWVEAGPAGLAFLLVLLATLLAQAVRVARHHPDPAARGLALLLAADALAQSMCQNWLNSVYHATFLVLALGLLARQGRILAEHPA